MALPLYGIGERREVAPQGIEEMQAIQDAEALIGGAEGVDVGIVGHEVRGPPDDGASHDDVVIGIGWDARRNICCGEGDLSAHQEQLTHKLTSLIGSDALGYDFFAILRT